VHGREDEKPNAAQGDMGQPIIPCMLPCRGMQRSSYRCAFWTMVKGSPAASDARGF
jgi:hypothetical protein